MQQLGRKVNSQFLAYKLLFISPLPAFAGTTPVWKLIQRKDESSCASFPVFH